MRYSSSSTLRLRMESKEADFLYQIVRETELIDLENPSLDDFIGPRRRAREIPPLPDVYVNSNSAQERHRDPFCDFDYDAEEEDMGTPHAVYKDRFGPHLWVQQRYDIARGFADLVAASGEGGWDVERRVRQSSNQHPCQGKGKGGNHNPVAKAWFDNTPFNPEVLRLCVPAKSAKPVSRRRGQPAPSSKDDFFISAFRPEGRKGQEGSRKSTSAPPLYHGKLPIDGDVRTAARFGIKPVLYKGDVVVVLVPLGTFDKAWREMDRGGNGDCNARAARAVETLPLSWRQLGCVPRLAVVADVFLKENVAQLALSSPIVPRDYAGPPLDFVPTHPGFGRTPPFFVKKLTIIGAVRMELEAIDQIHGTRFAATVQDPRVSAKVSALYVDQVQQTTDSPPRPHDFMSRYGQFDVIRPATTSILLQRQLNPWQLGAVRGVLFAARPDLPRGCVVERDRYGRMSGTPARAPEVLLIEGPPGTGKTQTIATAILNVLYHSYRTGGKVGRVLVCAPSNCAVDEVLLRLCRLIKSSDSSDLLDLPTSTLQGWKLLRVGTRDKVDPEVLKLQPPVYLDDLVDAEMSRRSDSDDEEWEQRKKIQSELVMRASVIFTTLGSLHRVRKMAESVTYAAVIVDEASQCTEPAVLQAMLVADDSAAFVLVGDSKQLQPTILSKESSQRGLRRSLLVRMLACGHKSFLLRTQYRMHPDICAFPNTYFYGGKLETHASVTQRQEAPICDAARTTVAEVFHSCPRFSMVNVAQGVMKTPLGSRSSTNHAEAVAVVQCMRHLRTLLRLSVKDMAPQVGIITFYNAQKDLIVSLLTHEERQSGLQVASVDSFQGKEKRIILLSCVRTLAERNSGPGFLAQWNRLNVALTRAKDLCVCFCNSRWIRTLRDESQPSHHCGGVGSVAHVLTTPKSTATEVVRQLDAHDRDPLALFYMLEHAEEREAVDVPALMPAETQLTVPKNPKKKQQYQKKRGQET